MGVVILGVYAAGIYSHQRRLLWLSSLLGIGLGLGLLCLAGMDLLKMMNLLQQQLSDGYALSSGYGRTVYLAQIQKAALFSLFGLMSLFVSLWCLAKSRHQE